LNLTEDQLQQLKRITTPRMTKYIREKPTPKQAAFLLLDCLEAFYGGAAGGGKSSALLAAALQYVDIPRYNAILFRRTYSDLALPGALMDRARAWLKPFPEVRWNEKDKTWIFPSGARLTFGYLEHESDKFRYQSAEFQFIGFDELTQFTETQYRYLFSRLRRLKGVNIPIRMRAASNPGGEGHDWVKQRFIVEGKFKGRVFIPARLEDNPHLDAEQYEESLKQLDPVTREQLRNGNWDIKAEGNMFHRSWFEIVSYAPKCSRVVRYWDFASTERSKKNRDPDWTVSVKLGERNGIYYVMDVKRVRSQPLGVELLVRHTASLDGRAVPIWIEQEPGSSGAFVVDHYARNVLKGYAVRGNRATGSKLLRADPVSSAAEGGRIKLVKGSWINDFLDELALFPSGSHDDQVDALSGAFEVISKAISLSAVPTSVGNEQSYWQGAG